jgi:hypothetical protein
MEQMLIKQFFDGLDDDDLRYNIEYLKMPKGLDEAVDLVYEHDEFRKIKRENTKHKVHAIQTENGVKQPTYPQKKLTNNGTATFQVDCNAELKEIKQALFKLTNQVNNLLNGQSFPAKNEVQERKCFKCGKPGHFKKQCPEKSSEQVRAALAYEEDDDACEECQSKCGLPEVLTEDEDQQLN